MGEKLTNYSSLVLEVEHSNQKRNKGEKEVRKENTHGSDIKKAVLIKDVDF